MVSDRFGEILQKWQTVGNHKVRIDLTDTAYILQVKWYLRDPSKSI
jgi:hypothetical protein